MATRGVYGGHIERLEASSEAVVVPTIATQSQPTVSESVRERWRVGAAPWTAIATGAAAVLAVFVRTFLVMSRSFPLNDGALFYLMAQEIGDHGFRLPMATAYNAANIPFAYSPLGFYLAAFLHVAGGVDLLGLFRALPLVFSCLCVLAFYLLAGDLAPTRSTRIASLVTFAVLPRSFLWLIMGGGLTRSMGFFFAILTLWQLYRVYNSQAWRHVAWATVFASLTVLSHLGTAPFVAFSAVLMLLSFGRTWRSLRASLVIVAGTIALTSPWWASSPRRTGSPRSSRPARRAERFSAPTGAKRSRSSRSSDLARRNRCSPHRCPGDPGLVRDPHPAWRVPTALVAHDHPPRYARRRDVRVDSGSAARRSRHHPGDHPHCRAAAALGQCGLRHRAGRRLGDRRACATTAPVGCGGGVVRPDRLRHRVVGRPPPQPGGRGAVPDEPND